MEDLDLLTFEPWADPSIGGFGQDPEGPYSRLGWLPLIGPSSWLLWGTLSAQLRREPQVTCELTTLAEAHGLQRGTGRNGMVRRVLHRLTSFQVPGTGEGGRGLGTDGHRLRRRGGVGGRKQARDRPAASALVELMQSRTQLRKIVVNLNQAVAELNTTGQVPGWLARAVERVDAAVERTDAATAAVAQMLLGGRR